MVKPEWGTKRTCPKCGTRFYDLGSADPVTCIECGTAWEPEPFLKSKQPLPFESVKKEREKVVEADEEEDLDVDLDEVNPDDETDIGGDDDLGDVATGKDGDED